MKVIKLFKTVLNKFFFELISKGKHLMKATTFLIIFNLINLMNLQSSQAQVTQEWVARYASNGFVYDHLNAMVTDDSGNIYLTGSIETGGNEVCGTFKYNTNGDLLWLNKYKAQQGNGARGLSIDVDAVGNVYVAGISMEGGNNMFILTIKYNSNGDTNWIKKFRIGSSQGLGIDVDASGNSHVSGITSIGSNTSRYTTIKYNSVGDTLWVRHYYGGFGSEDRPKEIKTDDSGNVYVTGRSRGSVVSYDNDFLTLKYSTNGDLIWIKRYSGLSNSVDEPQSICIDVMGNVIVTGHSDLTMVTVKYNSSGNQEWVRNFTPPTGISAGYSVCTDGSGNIYVTGSGYGFTLIKYNSNGDILWIKGGNQGGGYDIVISKNGSIYVSGVERIYNNYWDYITKSYNSSGEILWTKSYQGPSSGNDFAYFISLDGTGNVYVAGESEGINSYYDITTIKYSQQSNKVLHLSALIEGLYDNATNKMVRDTARVYLRNTSSPYSIIDSAKSVLDSNGKGTFSFANASNSTPYYIIVKHRNSIDTWSSTGQSFTSNTMSYDFTTSADKAYGDNLIQKGSKFCIYSGDVNRDGSVNLTDVIAINNDLSSFVTGYNPTDINGDNQSDLFDVVIAYNNSLKFISAQYPGSLDRSMSSAVEKKSEQGNKVELKDNYPNPFNPKTVISYELRVTNYVSLKVFDITGREVATLVNEVKEAGTHSVTFDASHLSSGVYFYKIKSGDFEQVKMMTQIK